MSGQETTPDSLSVISEAKRLQRIVEVLNSVDSESVVQLGNEGLRSNLIDPAQAYMADIHAKPGAFEHSGEGNYYIGLDLEKFDDIVGKAAADDLVDLVLNLENRKLKIEFGNADFDIASINPDTIRDGPGIPNPDVPNEFTVEARHLQRAVEMVRLVSEYCEVQCDPEAETIQLTGSGDTDDGTVDITEDVGYANVVEPTSSKLSVGGDKKSDVTGYLKEALDVIPPNVEVDVRTGEHVPILLEWEFEEAPVEVTQFVAPRVDTS